MEDFTGLIHKAQSGSESERRAAFDELVKRFWDMAYSRAYRTLNDAHMAEDAAQEAFITAYQRIEQLRDPLGFPQWLKRIVLTHCDRQIRGKHPQLEPLEARFDLAEDEPGPEATVENDEIRAIVRNAINALPEHERTVTEGFYIKGESQKELAERLQVPVTTVKKRLQYARQHLRGLMGELNEALDTAFDQMLNPPKPQRQPIPVYNRPQELPRDYNDTLPEDYD